MTGDEELERTVRKPAIDHAETRWLALRLDDDAKEIRQELRTMRAEHNARFDAIDSRLDSIDGQIHEHGAAGHGRPAQGLISRWVPPRPYVAAPAPRP